MNTVSPIRMTVLTLALCLSLSTSVLAQKSIGQVFPEQRSIEIRDPSRLQPARIPDVGVPGTVLSPRGQFEPQKISLDEAIQIALRNAKVIRVLGGVAAASSGRTVYDVAISNSDIDVQHAIFDPTFNFTTGFGKTDRPGATTDPGDPNASLIIGSSTDSVDTTLGLNKKMFNGADLGLNVTAVRSYFEPGVFPLEPEYRSSVEMTLRQPLMQGFGRDVNLAPVVVARINTERSFFQYKDSVQELVRGVINAYWNLVSARVDVWAREQQVKQAQFAFNRIKTRADIGFAARAADVAQAKSALANFRATLISARAALILSETALRNILGMDPSNAVEFVPTSKPVLDKVALDYEKMVAMAEQQRPDIIELKLVLEADYQNLLQANNQSRPQLDGTANYRWDGLEGDMPNGTVLRSGPGQFAGFNVGVNFSVPLGLRQGRASLRRQELVLARDRANLEQGVFQMVHQLTINYRNIDQFFEQIAAFKEARIAARLNYENQVQDYLTGRRELLNAIQAITDWGNAVSQEASSITAYNTELANVERQTGTILETHGIRFVEETYGSLGPRGLLGITKSTGCYAQFLQPSGGIDNYEESDDTSDDVFELEDLAIERRESRPNENAPDKKATDEKLPNAVKATEDK